MREAGLVVAVLLAVACGRPEPIPEGAAPFVEPASPVVQDRAASDLRVVVVGDSLTAGYGLAEDQAYPALLEQALRDHGWSVEVINGGVSGDTTAGGLARLEWLLRQEPDLVVIALGANDGLRGQPIESIADNLRRMAERSREAGARVLLLGMRVPPNYGEDYAGSFAAVYPSLAEELGLPLMPFLLDGVGGRIELNLADGIHPNAEGQARIAEAVLPFLEPIVRELAAGKEAA